MRRRSARSSKRGKRARSEIKYKVLEEGIATKELALALEALHAARAVLSEPDSARGGPWSKPTLPDDWREEVTSAAACRALASLNKVAMAHPSGRLFRHLKDLAFVSADDAPKSAAIARGSCAMRARRGGRSGGTGWSSRQRRLRLPTSNPNHLRKGTRKHTRLQRGIQAKANRAKETARYRPMRPSRAMKA